MDDQNNPARSLVEEIHHKGGQVIGIRDREAEAFQFIGKPHDRAYLKSVLEQAGFVVEEADLNETDMPLIYLETHIAATALAPGDRVRLTARGLCYQGKLGTVEGVAPNGRLLVRIDGRRKSLAFDADELTVATAAHERL